SAAKRHLIAPPQAVHGFRRTLPRRSLSPLLLLFWRRWRWLRRGDRLRGGSDRRGDNPLDHVLLADRPEVGRDPVEDEAGGEVDYEGNEDEGQERHHHPLAFVG